MSYYKDIHQQAQEAFDVWMEIADKLEAAVNVVQASLDDYHEMEGRWEGAASNLARLQKESLKEATAKRD